MLIRLRATCHASSGTQGSSGSGHECDKLLMPTIEKHIVACMPVVGNNNGAVDVGTYPEEAHSPW